MNEQILPYVAKEAEPRGRILFLKATPMAEDAEELQPVLTSHPAMLGRIFYFRICANIHDYEEWRFDHPALLTEHAGYVLPSWGEVREVTGYKTGRYILYGTFEISDNAGAVTLRLNRFGGDFMDLIHLVPAAGHHKILWQHPELLQLASPQEINETKMIFCGGVPKSGTTWLEKIINAHPGALMCGENNLFDNPHLQFTHRSVLGSFPAPFNRYLPHYASPTAHRLMLYAARARMLLGLLQNLAPQEIATKPHYQGWLLLGDRTPGNSGQIVNILLAFPEAKFIHIKRRAADVFLSRLHHEKNIYQSTPPLCQWPEWMAKIAPALLEHGDAALQRQELQPYIKKLAVAVILEWQMINQSADEFSELFPTRILTLQYEAMLQDPQASIRKIFAYLGIPTTAEQRAAIEAASSFRALSGGRKSGEANQSAFFRAGVAGGGEAAFLPQMLKDIETLSQKKPEDLYAMIPEMRNLNIEGALTRGNEVLGKVKNPLAGEQKSQSPESENTNSKNLAAEAAPPTGKLAKNAANIKPAQKVPPEKKPAPDQKPKTAGKAAAQKTPATITKAAPAQQVVEKTKLKNKSAAKAKA